MNQSIIFFFAAILLVGALLLAFISRVTPSRYCKRLNVDDYRVKYLSIENQLKRDEPSSYHLSVLNADKLVDQALKCCGFRGETMGERMKSATTKLSDCNGVWTAHKLRNRIAHEPEVKVSYDDARHALGNFKRALKDLGAI